MSELEQLQLCLLAVLVERTGKVWTVQLKKENWNFQFVCTVRRQVGKEASWFSPSYDFPVPTMQQIKEVGLLIGTEYLMEQDKWKTQKNSELK